MKTFLLGLTLLSSSVSFAEVKVGAQAPVFSEADHAGKTHTLDTHKGKWVVLEWYNEGCPYVKKHYGTQNMQKLQETYTKKGVVWLTVATSPKGEQGYVDPAKAAEHHKTVMKSTALLLDSDGTMGRAYDAKTTPHMFVINPEGKVVYAGAIDNNDSSNPKTVSGAKNFVAQALDEGMAGKTVTQASWEPYGCSVKYN